MARRIDEDTILQLLLSDNSDEENSSDSEKEDHIEVDLAYESVSEDEVSSLTQYPPPGLDVQVSPLRRHIDLSEDPIRLLHPEKETFGDFIRAFPGVSFLLFFQAGRLNHHLGVRQWKPIVVRCRLRGEGGSTKADGFRAGQYPQKSSGVIEYIDQPFLFLYHPPYRSSQGDNLRFKDCAEGIEPERRVSGLLSVPPFRQGLTDLALYSVSVGVDLRPDHCKTVHCLEIKILDALISDLGHVRRVKQITEIYGPLGLPVGKNVPQFFSALLLIYPGRFPNSNIEREQPREDQRGMQGDCTVSPAHLKINAALDNFRTASFSFACA
ncbi:hypothetical protein EVAR_19637_1 [Eumeta japonica]|uniref:Uncharacterized protein n=1 Tax=Eumeta variegata TaxID=151549 RepID=A0A4C1UGV4_EUMVA|nr:hypothetical protein EVAR_19637_1 [Eumeta japonica]